ncbi:nuclear transport factor 2 family protein [Burkholderia sp. Ac-20365]|uniref:nuclear transport factor 2 family protein n=1 Tax=Burkholderia sp. Ac-20365 TaxID=2703897 RepID=UPI00197B1DC8|nr:nuclear transport factor 2 family protein [Burkholderia sp. Ac-20365]MBN3762001.1 nuclear transport factor 2 family protein [Burkholderia sp. Ac-20365]
MSNHKPTVEQRITRLEDIESITRLKAEYARKLDNHFDGDGLASLFVEDGIWTIKGVGGEAKGRDGIKHHCCNLRQSISWAQHNILSAIVDVSADGYRANASFYLLCLLTMKASPNSPKEEAVVLSGKYSDKFIKIDGKWLIEEVSGVIEQSAPWTQGWVASQLVKESW